MVKPIIQIGSAVIITLTTLNAFSATPLTDEASINMIVKQLTPQEKAKLVAGTGMNNATLVPGAAGSTFAIPRLGIPQIVMADGPVGVRLGAGPTGGAPRYATAFPISSALAASWNEDLVFQVASVMGDEAKSYGVDVLLGPALNIQRDPLNGRNFEYFSEDPFLSGKITAAFVNGIQSRGIGATIKHYVANNQETNRQSINQLISERALREIYLAGFEYAIKNSHPWAVMSSYPAINGTFVSQDSRLLKQILRDEWGFKGMVMSDWYGVKDPVQSLLAGNDLMMPGGLRDSDSVFQGENKAPEQVVMEGLEQGALLETSLDDNIRAILGLVVKSAVFKGNKPQANPSLDQHTGSAHRAAVESMVMLKNNHQTLPIPLDQKIALFGSNSQHFYIGGGGSAEVNVEPGRAVGLIDGLANAGYQLITKMNEVLLHEGISPQQIMDVAAQSDIAMIAIGRSSSEGADRYSMALHPQELALIKNVADVYHGQNKKVVVVLNIGAPVEMMKWDNDADAILLAWQPGQEAGNALADILSGKVSPSGKLPMTFPKYYHDAPSYGNFPGYNGRVNYGEGIYVGYRFYDSRDIQPMYPFGHGLSYASFAYSNIKLNQPTFNLDADNQLIVSIEVQNDGKMLAKDVVQLYIQDKASRIDRPLQELKGFHKVELRPGEKQTISFVIDQRSLSFFDTALNRWVVEPGRFIARIGRSSRDIGAEIEFKATSVKAPAISLQTPWLTIQTYQQAATIVANYIGDDETNAWIRGNPTLGDKMNTYFSQQAELKDNKAAQQQLLDKLLNELNDL